MSTRGTGDVAVPQQIEDWVTSSPLDLFGSQEPPEAQLQPQLQAQPAQTLRVQMLASGWRQGVILPPELALQVVPVPGGYPRPSGGTWPDDQWYIVVSQDCDIVHGSLSAEPVVEVLLATRIAACVPKHEHLRTPRLLHLTLTDSTGQRVPVAVEIIHRGFLDREHLPEAAPLAGLRADAGAVQELAAMLGRRYLRASRPETFDRRLKPAMKLIEGILKDGAENASILDILFRIEPLGELPPNAPYTVEAFVVLQDAFDDLEKLTTRPAIDALRKRLRDALNRCDGIEVEVVHAVGRRDIDLRQRDALRSLEIVWPRFEADASDDHA